MRYGVNKGFKRGDLVFERTMLSRCTIVLAAAARAGLGRSRRPKRIPETGLTTPFAGPASTGRIGEKAEAIELRLSPLYFRRNFKQQQSTKLFEFLDVPRGCATLTLRVNGEKSDPQCAVICHAREERDRTSHSDRFYTGPRRHVITMCISCPFI